MNEAFDQQKHSWMLFNIDETIRTRILKRRIIGSNLQQNGSFSCHASELTKLCPD